MAKREQSCGLPAQSLFARGQHWYPWSSESFMSGHQCDKGQAATNHGEPQLELVAVCVAPLGAETRAWAGNPSRNDSMVNGWLQSKGTESSWTFPIGACAHFLHHHWPLAPLGVEQSLPRGLFCPGWGETAPVVALKAFKAGAGTQQGEGEAAARRCVQLHRDRQESVTLKWAINH